MRYVVHAGQAEGDRDDRTHRTHRTHRAHDTHRPIIRLHRPYLRQSRLRLSIDRWRPEPPRLPLPPPDGHGAFGFECRRVVGAGCCSPTAVTSPLRRCAYTRRTARYADNPIHSMVYPLAFLLVVGAGIAWDEVLGRNLFYLYLTWSPYHYAAQSYGLLPRCTAIARAANSMRRIRGCSGSSRWSRSLMPSCTRRLRALMWFVPEGWFAQHGNVGGRCATCLNSSSVPSRLCRHPSRSSSRRVRGGRAGLPGISYLILLSNGVWWVAFQYTQAFGWATVAHSVQYLAIVLIFHVRETRGRHRATCPCRRPRRRLIFYAKCLALGYVLFHVLCRTAMSRSAFRIGVEHVGRGCGDQHPPLPRGSCDLAPAGRART